MQSLRVDDNTELRILVEADAEELVTLGKSYPHAPQIDEWLAREQA